MRASYGDSFTYADEVEDGEAWANVLSERMACRVANFGVGGYGTDQAFLRFRAQNGARARVAILWIFPFDLMRNVNQFRYFLASSNHFGLKPRFVQHEDGLHLVALPTVSYEGYLASLSDSGDFYPHETFIPDTELGPISLGFPFTSVVVRYFLSARLQNYLRGRPGWIDFFAADHCSSPPRSARASPSWRAHAGCTQWC